MNGEKIPVVISDTPFKTAYGPRERALVDVSAETHGTNVKQSFKDEVDVNRIMVRFRQTGVLPSPGPQAPIFMDVSEMPSYQKALEHVRAVERHFAGLSAEVRDDFRNDAAFFADWVSDPANFEEAKRRYGLEAPGGDPVLDSGAVGGSTATTEEVTPS